MEISIRHSTLSDLTKMQEMFLDTISTVCSDDYSPKQIRVWISSVKNQQRWKDKLAGQYFLVAEFNHRMVGYASSGNNDCMIFYMFTRTIKGKALPTDFMKPLKTKPSKERQKLSVQMPTKRQNAFLKKKDLKRSPQMCIIKGVEIINYKMAKTL